MSCHINYQNPSSINRSKLLSDYDHLLPRLIDSTSRCRPVSCLLEQLSSALQASSRELVLRSRTNLSVLCAYLVCTRTTRHATRQRLFHQSTDLYLCGTQHQWRLYYASLDCILATTACALLGCDDSTTSPRSIGFERNYSSYWRCALGRKICEEYYRQSARGGGEKRFLGTQSPPRRLQILEACFFGRRHYCRKIHVVYPKSILPLPLTTLPVVHFVLSTDKNPTI